MSRAFLRILPQLVQEGLIEPSQADRIRARFATDDQSGSRMLLVFAILGSLLIGLGIMLVIAHNWDDLSRPTRTAIAFVPVLLGQGLVVYALRAETIGRGWREGSAIFLACALCACVALISQIYHISGELDGYLFTCSLLVLPLLYLPGSLITALCYLAMITWYGWLVHFERWGDAARPWLLIPLIAAAVPYYLQQARSNGTTVGFWWLSLFMALTVGMATQLFHTDWEVEHALGMMAIASSFTLVPWLHPRLELRTWPWVLVGGATVLVLFFTFSFRMIWMSSGGYEDRGLGQDLVSIAVLIAIGSVAYGLSLRRRKPFERWPWPEAMLLFFLCYAVGLFAPALAAVLMNLALLVLGVMNVKRGIEQDSLRRMNLGLLILGLTILLRFFDSDLSFVLRGLAFIAIGAGFLYMNLRLVQKRKRDGTPQ